MLLATLEILYIFGAIVWTGFTSKVGLVTTCKVEFVGILFKDGSYINDVVPVTVLLSTGIVEFVGIVSKGDIGAVTGLLVIDVDSEGVEGGVEVFDFLFNTKYTTTARTSTDTNTIGIKTFLSI